MGSGRNSWLLAMAFLALDWHPVPATVDSRLTAFPRARTPRACQGWAATQPPDEIARWGITSSGQHVRERALLRLTLVCLGDDWPDIVTFGSSIGASVRYCNSHPGQPICADTEAYCARHRADCAF